MAKSLKKILEEIEKGNYSLAEVKERKKQVKQLNKYIKESTIGKHKHYKPKKKNKR